MLKNNCIINTITIIGNAANNAANILGCINHPGITITKNGGVKHNKNSLGDYFSDDLMDLISVLFDRFR